MYKNRHSGNNKNTSGWGSWACWRVAGGGVGVLTLQCIILINITVRKGNLWLSNVAATMFRRTLFKAQFASAMWERENEPRQDAASSTLWCHHCALLQRSLVPSTVCDSLGLWTQRSLAVRLIRALQVSLSSRRESKKWLHWSKWH